MFYDALSNTHGLAHDPFKALVAPRPIGWICTLSQSGIVNLAPYSFFNAIASNPHYVMFSSAGRKDSTRNAEETGAFVCSLATFDLKDQVNATSRPVAPDVDEMELAGLTPAPSRLVAPPRVKESPVAFECEYFQTIELPSQNGSQDTFFMVIGRVLGIYIDDAAIVDGMVDITRLRPIARLGYQDYAVVDSVFQLIRPER